MQSVGAGVLGLLALAWSLYVVAGAVTAQGIGPIFDLLASGPLFWLAFLLSVLAEPLALCLMLHRLFGAGLASLLPLVQRQAYNSLLFSYAGDAYFTAFLERCTDSARAALGLAGDMAIASGVVNNLFTLALLGLMWPQFAPVVGQHWGAGALASVLAFAAIPVVLAVWRRKQLQGVGGLLFAAMLLRTIAYCLFLALSWHFVLPGTGWSVLAMLVTARMVVCRLPFIPNKDIAFAASVILFAGPDARIGVVLSGLALLGLATEAGLLVLASAVPVLAPWLPRRAALQPAPGLD